MPGTFSPPPRFSDSDMHQGTCVTHVPWCMPGSLIIGFLWSWWRGKRSRHSRRMRNPQFYASGKRAMSWYHHGFLVILQRLHAVSTVVSIVITYLLVSCHPHALPGPISLPHVVSRDVEFRGYHLPKGAMVIANLYNTLRDDQNWEDPLEFRPERWLDENGALRRHAAFIPFSMGKMHPTHTIFCQIPCDAVYIHKNIHKAHPIARPLGQGIGCLLWIQPLMYVLPQSLSCHVQIHVMLDRAMKVLDCISQSSFVEELAKDSPYFARKGEEWGVVRESCLTKVLPL